MKYTTYLGAAALLLFAACTEHTETHTTEGQTTTVSNSTTETTTYSVDTAAAGTAIDRAEEVAKEAAHKTGTALEKAGQEIQEETKDDVKKKDVEKKKPPQR